MKIAGIEIGFKKAIHAHEVHDYVKTIPGKNKEKAETVEKMKLSAPATRQKMKDIGFSNIKEVDEADRLDEKQEEAMAFAKNYQKYLDAFPWGIYLTKKDVDEICEKYNLWYGESSAFIDSIPRKNMNEIISKGKMVQKYFTQKRRLGDFSNVPELNYYIIAPKKMFNLDGHKEKGRKISKIVVVDPIVMVELPKRYRDEDGDYLVITMWGPEAELLEVKR